MLSFHISTEMAILRTHRLDCIQTYEHNTEPEIESHNPVQYSLSNPMLHTDFVEKEIFLYSIPFCSSTALNSGVPYFIRQLINIFPVRQLGTGQTVPTVPSGTLFAAFSRDKIPKLWNKVKIENIFTAFLR